MGTTQSLPSVIRRNVLENPVYTAYTPYQEIAQAVGSPVNFQTMVCDLTGMNWPMRRCSMRLQLWPAAMVMAFARVRAMAKSEPIGSWWMRRFTHRYCSKRARSTWCGIEVVQTGMALMRCRMCLASVPIP